MKDNNFFYSKKYSKPSWLICMITVILLASILTGCARSRQFQKVREEYPHKLRVVVSNFSADSKQIFIEDVANLSDYYRDKLEQTGLFSVERDTDIIDSFSIPSITEDTNLMRKLSQNNLIEGVISGTIKKYYYKKERRSFAIALALDVEVHDTFTGEKIYSTSKSYDRKFRLKRKGQKDYSGLNQQLLDQVLGQINNEMILEVSKVIEERKAQNGGEFTTVMSGNETRNLLLWPKDAIKTTTNGSTRVGDLPIPNIRSLAAKKRGNSQKLEMNKLASSIAPKVVEPKYAPKKKKEFNSDDLLDMGFDSISKKEKETEFKTNKKNFHLKVKGFKLVYPLEWDPSKKYSKFYYLVDSEKYKNKDIVDIDASMEDNLVLEIFSTVDRLAVRRFLDDYFQGVSSNPVGKILEVYERAYMGKLQIGFVLNDKAVIASIHRKHRETLLQGLTGLYIKNGGVSVEKLVQESIKRRFSNRGLVLPDEPPTKKIAKALPKTVKKKVAQTKRAVKKVKRNRPSSKELIKRKMAQNMPKTINIAKVPKVRRKTSTRAQRPKVVKKKSSKMIPANAVFFYDMAKRRFDAHDYESAYRYFNLALDKGYDLPEVHDYLFKIEKIQSGEVDSSANSYVSGAQELSTEGFISNLEYEDSAPGATKNSRNYQYEAPQNNFVRQSTPVYNQGNTQPAVQSQSRDFNTKPPVQQYEQEAYQSISTNVNLAQATKAIPNTSTPTIKKKSKMDTFFNEMEDMEKELQSLLNKKKGLFTVDKGTATGGFWGFFFQFMAVVSLSLGLFSFILTKNIK